MANRSVYPNITSNILKSKAFRRLKGKTQAFAANTDDYSRDRLTHTLEVYNIASAFSNEFKLNEDLVRAISYLHDIGHTPFGHVGERTLNKISYGEKEYVEHYISQAIKEYPLKVGFKHNLQSARILDVFEPNIFDNVDDKIKKMVITGVIYHSSVYYKEEKPLKDYETVLNRWQTHSIEELVVYAADEIAQIMHDTEDSEQKKIICETDFITYMQLHETKSMKTIINSLKLGSKANQGNDSNSLHDILDENLNFSKKVQKYVVEFVINEIIKSFYKFLDDNNLTLNKLQKLLYNNNEIYKSVQKVFNPCEYDSFKVVKEFLENRVLKSQETKNGDSKGENIVKNLFKWYTANPLTLPEATIEKICEVLGQSHIYETKLLLEDLPTASKESIVLIVRVIINYISGMTDRFAIEKYRQFYNF